MRTDGARQGNGGQGWLTRAVITAIRTGGGYGATKTATIGWAERLAGEDGQAGALSNKAG